MYCNNFESWADVQSSFEIQDTEPDEVILASYEGSRYDGRAYVVYRNSDRYFLNEASHCSCWGLEGQWAPEEYSKWELVEYLKRIRSPSQEQRYVLDRLLLN